MQVRGSVVEMYRDFARYAVDSPCFVAWAEGVLADPPMLRWLGRLPEQKRQPNLVFAAARWHGVPAPAPYDVLRAALLGDDGTIRATILARSTQTNEVGRLATLLPAFAIVAQGRPLALLEVGASAGLCLYPDHWGYRWETDDGPRLLGPAEPTLRCAVSGPAPLPDAVPEVVWRGGIDLNPLDVTDPDDMAWLAQLVWPEHHDRRRRLRTAIDVARRDPPRLHRGDLQTDLAGVIEEAQAAVGPDGRVVVFHSAVLAYLEERQRTRFSEQMRRLLGAGLCHWVSNEAGGALRSVTLTGPEPPGGRFVLGIDGRSVGHTHGHGRELHWW